MQTVFETNFSDLNLIRKGKVREVYDLGENLLIVASDRVSAFDVIMEDPIPLKGVLLNQISAFWLKSTKQIIDNHFITDGVEQYPDILSDKLDILEGRSMIVKKADPLPVELVVRGYIAGSGWKEYQETGEICGVKLPEGLVKYQKLPEPIFTPATKADEGHDENINFEQYCNIIGNDKGVKLRDVALNLYSEGRRKLEEAGIILCDTKFEFGSDSDGNLILIDEALTPDSSRFWLKDTYEPGKEQQNFDKQVLRDYLESIEWDKNPPAPALPQKIKNAILDKYLEAYRRILGKDFNG